MQANVYANLLTKRRKNVKLLDDSDDNTIQERVVAAQDEENQSTQDNDVETRDKLVNTYFNYASSIAAKLARSLSSDIDFDDVLCNARLGLLEAAKRYNPKFGVDFKTFAYYRIKGAVYDGLRKTGWIPRSLYSRIKFEKAANEYLEATAHRPDSKSEFLRKELGELQDSMNSLASIYVMSIDSIENFDVEDSEAKKQIEQRAEFQKVKEKVCDAIESLPDKERKLIKMYYFQNKTMEEIGEQLELSKSWTSRLHARALELMFKKVSAMGADTLE